MKLLAIDGNSIMNRALRNKAAVKFKGTVHECPYGVYEYLPQGDRRGKA